MSTDSLHIYDAADPIVSLERGGYHDLPIRGGVRGLFDALNQLVKEGKTFRKVLWSTHGQSGEITFLNVDLDHSRPWKNPSVGRSKIDYLSFVTPEWTGYGYEKLFPLQTKMVFSGCDVADGDVGWKFLENAGKLFLHGGGTVTGWTSKGFATFGGHISHFSGEIRTVIFGAHGRIIGRDNSSNWGPKTQRERAEVRGNIGNKI